MRRREFDVAVVGAGPAGSVAALVLARGGASVALVDKASFPREKACGDLIGPRGVALLDDLGVKLSGAVPAGDMVLVGPTGARVRLPAFAGRDYPGYGLMLRRDQLDEQLRQAAIAAGATAIAGRCTGVEPDDAGRIGTVVVRYGGADADGDTALHADAIIGADGAVSTVARCTGLLDPAAVLWGFALRTYLPATVAEPTIVLLDERAWRAFPGYGWVFPGADGTANVGLGVGVGGHRPGSRLAGERFAAFCARLGALGLPGADAAGARRTGGWLKLGGIGTVPARGHVLLVGDAAGLVNPLQGEGIGPAMESGALAAEALLAGPDLAARRYRSAVRDRFTPYLRAVTPLHASMLGHPLMTAGIGRALTAPRTGRAVAATWSLFWNDLGDGARPRPAATLARALRTSGAVLTARTAARRRLDADFGDEPALAPVRRSRARAAAD